MTQADQVRIGLDSNDHVISEIWYLLGPAVGAAHNISVPNTGGVALCLMASSYISGTAESAFDVSNGDAKSTATATANPSISVTTTADGDVIVGVLGDGYNTVPTGQTGTVLYSTADATNAWTRNSQYYLQAATGAWATGWTVATNNWASCVAAFKQVPAGASASVSPSVSPSASVSASASASPSVSPSASPSVSPSASPSVSPSASPSAAAGISDDFSADTSANYTVEAGGFSISGGAAHGAEWDTSVIYHETTLGSPNHYVQAKIKHLSAADYSGVVARYNYTDNTGYAAIIVSATLLVLYELSGEALNWVAQYSGAYTSGTFYTIKLEVNGTAIKVYEGETQRISVTNGTYTTGNYAGLYFYRDGANGDATLDDLAANAL